MKKLSLLIALALIVTISGVYAAWNYAQGATASLEITREINMAQINTNSNKGSISATPTDVAFIVDDGGSYTTTLKGTGKFDIAFTPAAGADTTIVNNGIKMNAVITVEGSAKYNDTVLLAHKEGQNVIPLTGEGTSLTATLAVAQILDCVELAEVQLDTLAKNKDYHAVLSSYRIVITINEVVAP